MGFRHVETHFTSLSARLLYFMRQSYRFVEYTECYNVVVSSKTPCW